MKQSHAPLLACKVDLAKIKYPILASPKIDGIRCIVVKGKPLSRKLKLIPNKHIQATFAAADKNYYNLTGYDGELVVGLDHGEGVFQRTSSGVMSRGGQPNFTYVVFDRQVPSEDYNTRFADESCSLPWVRILPQKWIYSEEALLEFEKYCLGVGYEGVIGRSPSGLYKHGRSTMKEGTLWKLVRYDTDEATIKDFKEQQHNDNELQRDNLGHAKRSSAKAGKRPAGILGAFVVESEKYRDVFDVGTGFTAAQRKKFWAQRKRLAGKLIRYKHKPIGAVDVPRHPVFQGFRSKIDL